MTSTTTRPRRIVDPLDDDQELDIEELLPGLKRVADVEREDVKFVWYPYIPAGKLTLIEGDPGLGKSWIGCDIAARLSTGTPFPGEDGPRIPQKVLILSAEDGIAETIRPRLEALGADLTKVYADDEPFTFTPQKMEKLEMVMGRVPAAITFIDPIVGYMGGKMDMHRANEVRELMSQLQGAAKRTGSAVILVRHLRKAGGQNAKYRGIGSIDFTAAVRSQLQVGETKTGTTFMEHVKHNLSPAGPALRYEVVDGKFQWTGGMDWRSEEKKKVSTKARVDVAGFLQKCLADGPKTGSRVIHEALEAGISESLLMKRKTGVAHSRKIGNVWMWELDVAPQPPAPPQEIVVSMPSEEDPLVTQALSRIGRGNV